MYQLKPSTGARMLCLLIPLRAHFTVCFSAAEVESLGLDISYHGGSSYPHDRAHSSWVAPKGDQVRVLFIEKGNFRALSLCGAREEEGFCS